MRRRRPANARGAETFPRFLLLAPLPVRRFLGSRQGENTFPDEVAYPGAAIHHVAVRVIDGLGDRHDFAPTMLNDEHLVGPQLPDKEIGTGSLRTRAHKRDDRVSQETDLHGIAPLHRDGTTLPRPLETDHEPLVEAPGGYVDATIYSNNATNCGNSQIKCQDVGN